MPAPDPSQILTNPPPLTPAALEQFPYGVIAFPQDSAAQDAGLVYPKGAPAAGAVEGGIATAGN